MKQYYVYIVASLSKRLYTGVTSKLETRVFQHKTKQKEGFTKRYHIGRLVYFETFRNVREAIAWEKEIKGWVRKKKIDLIESMNPTWKDLSAGWFDDSFDARR